MRTRLSSTLLSAAAFCVFSASAALGQGFSHVVAFGDSLSDRGNTVTMMDPLDSWIISWGMGYDDVYYGANFNPYSIAAAGRFSSGPVWVEYLNAKLFGGSSATTPVDLGMNNGSSTTSTGTNFAWGGSLSGSGYYSPISGYNIHNLLTQIDSYKANTVLQPNAGTTLFTVWTGGNDAMGWVDTAPDLDDPAVLLQLDTLTTTVISNIATAVTSLYTEGGRHFLLPNLPALGFKPNFIGTDDQERANAFVDQYNSKLAAWIASAGLDDATLYTLDVFTFFEDIRLNPQNYGLSNSTDAAYTYSILGSTIEPNPDTYVFWDNTHPTAQVHAILGNLAYQAIPEPSTYLLLSAGAALGLWARRRKAA